MTEWRKGDEYVLAPDAKYRSNGRFHAVDDQGFVPGVVVVVARDGQDGDGDIRIRMADSTNGSVTYVQPEYLLPIGAAPAGNTVRIPKDIAVSAAEAFQEGNEVQFDVVVRDNGTRYTVGCKSARRDILLPMIQKLERGEGENVTLTLRGIVKNGRISCDGEWVDGGDVQRYCQNIRLISVQEVSKPNVTVELTHAEAEAIGALSAKVGGNPHGYRGHAESGLRKINKAAGYDDWKTNPAYVNGKLEHRPGVSFND